MNKPISLRLEGEQRVNLTYLSRVNHGTKPCKLIRIGVEFLTRLAEMNGGQIPMLEQVRLQRALVRRARRDKQRSNKQ